MKYAIPFNRPYCSPGTQENFLQVLSSDQIAGNGHFGRGCAEVLQAVTGSQRAYLTPSCTAALEMSALLLDLQPGDEVIVPSFTFVSTACAYAIFGVRPIFVDVTPETLNIDPTLVEAAITERTKAIVAVHYAGVACDLDALLDICNRRGLRLVEDNAHGLFGTCQRRPLGSFGSLATLSFHETKNISCGEGGALLVNDGDLLERADMAQEKGTNRSRFFRGMIDRYTWVDRGSSYLLGEFPAAALRANLDNREHIQRHRSEIWQRYHTELEGWAATVGIRRPVIADACSHPSHLYYLLLPDSCQRQAFIAFLKSYRINAVFHYQPLHLSPMGKKLGGRDGQCPVTERIADQLVRLPLYTNLSRQEQDQVIEAVLKWS